MEGVGLSANNKQKQNQMLPNKMRGEFTRNQRKDSEGLSEAPDLEFEYSDADKWTVELSVPDQKWTELDSVQHRAHAMRLLDGLDVIGRERRLKVARAILYMAQGTFGECSSELEVQHWMRYNVFLLLDVGAFTALVELLNMEIE
ncbi:striatin-interacting 1 -like protein [Labeo rohita]|uniref:Striatin-interacting 1-like protein n=1 Tax=Labeo rohita TaxID=84645 RepID=A0A498P716_LABRO|nr:striatin-interacting 1 -like protein [Labeo rohita]